MLRYTALLVLAFAGCASSEQPLRAGTWWGALTPMNHPEMANPVSYDVSYPDGVLAIALTGPGGETLPTRDLRLDGDTLRFVFDEPDAGLPLICALGRNGDDFAGRCTDPGGQWARFTMLPPR